MSKFLEVKNIFKHYANHTALKDVSLHVNKGEIYGLLGPNGAGKSSLIRIINQITAPDAGTVYMEGRALCPQDVVNVGYLPEERGLYRKMKVGEHAIYLAQLKGLSKKDAIRKLNYWFEKFDIMPWWNKKVDELSKGMQQKVQFICTILHEPALLIFDEPFSGFDPINTEMLREEILQLKEQGTTIIFSTHNMESVEQICDRIALINQSVKILEGSVKEIKQEHKPNLIDICYDGDEQDLLSPTMENIFQVETSISQDSQVHARIQKAPGLNNTAVLQYLVEQKIEITAFNEVIPSMNDIFIRLVKAAHQKTKSNQ